jgi:hypothetical protein
VRNDWPIDPRDPRAWRSLTATDWLLLVGCLALGLLMLLMVVVEFGLWAQ